MCRLDPRSISKDLGMGMTFLCHGPPLWIVELGPDLSRTEVILNLIFIGLHVDCSGNISRFSCRMRDVSVHKDDTFVNRGHCVTLPSL